MIIECFLVILKQLEIIHMRINVKNEKSLMKSLNKVLNTDMQIKIKGISIDSREVKDNDLFICLKGERGHGSDFIDDTLLDKVSIIISDKEFLNDKVHLVDNSKDFLVKLAMDFRAHLNVKFIGITGTNGKTSTKELLVHFLKTEFNVSYSKKSYNSTVGLPLSILECDEKSEFCVLEMGASKRGEIEYLCSIANPDFGLVTNISKAHLDGFSSFKDLINTKMSIYECINSRRGTFFLNNDDSNIPVLSSSDCSVVSFSMTNIQSDYYANISDIDKGIIYVNNCLFEIPYLTHIFASNFLSSYSIASNIGVSNSSIKKVLRDFRIPEGRGNIISLPNMKIINDTYNANLESMRKGISQLKKLSSNSVKIKLILGDMLELSDESVEIHNELGRYIDTLDFIDTIYGVGSAIRNTLESINKPFVIKEYFANNEELIEHLKVNPINDGVVYLKGSRGIKLEQIVDYLNVK